MKTSNRNGECILVMAPVGHDAQAIADLLVERGLDTFICGSTEECFARLSSGAGALILTEEALEIRRALDLLEALNKQPPWSELPLIILTAGHGSHRGRRLLKLAAAAAGSATLLERPISTATLLHSVEVALKSRRRQYQVRDLLQEQRRTAQKLKLANERVSNHARSLERVVRVRTASLMDSYDRLRKEMAERAESEKARDGLRRQLLNAQEEERRRIARELHDQMGQNLTALHLGLKSLHDSDRCCDAVCDLVRPLQELATQTARDLHRVALELRPSVLDDLGLVKALRQLVETWSAACRIPVDLETTGYSARNVTPEMKTALYRIVQEALNNIAKHSGAKHVSVILCSATDHVKAIVEDDGRGFEAERARQSADGRGRLGLAGIQERLSVIGGTLDLESSPGNGATLVVRIPIPAKA